MLRDNDLKADIRHCSFDKPSWAEAGFHINPIMAAGKVAFMVVLREHLAPDALTQAETSSRQPWRQLEIVVWNSKKVNSGNPMTFRFPSIFLAQKQQIT